jgi:hypothetical protein
MWAPVLYNVIEEYTVPNDEDMYCSISSPQVSAVIRVFEKHSISLYKGKTNKIIPSLKTSAQRGSKLVWTHRPVSDERP